MQRKIDTVLNQFVEEINKMLGRRIKKIILYGSYARGDYNKNSDIDIMILVDMTDKEIDEYKEKIWNLAYDIELERNIVISPLIRNIDKYEKRVNIIPFYINIQKEGVVLHG